MPRVIVLLALACLVLGPASPCGVQRTVPPPRYVVLHLAGVDLLHAGEQGVVRRLGRAQVVGSGAGRTLRYRDTGQQVTLEFGIDDESGAIRSARAAIERPGGTASEVRLTRPLTGNGLSLGDSPAVVQKALGKPHRRVDGRDASAEWVYRQPMRADGSLPAYEGRWRFVGGRLAALRIRIGE